MLSFHVDLHHHCNCDPIDHLSYSAQDLVDEAAEKGLHAIAITPHRDVFADPHAVTYAREKGVLLIPGVEKMIEGMEVVILNVTPPEISEEFSFSDLADLRERRGGDILVFAPHPFYPRPTCVGPRLDEFPHLFDAVEHAHLYVRGWNPNLKAIQWASQNNKAVLANTDSHGLGVLGRNYSIVEASELTCSSLFDSIRAGQVEIVSQPHSLIQFGFFAVRTVLYQALCRLMKRGTASPRA
jgi:predicted metal-dependent phosphoesterase TrpH